MCALRNSRNVNPTALATSYRFDMNPKRNNPPVSVKKRDKRSYPVNIPSIDVLDINSNVHDSGYRAKQEDLIDEFDDNFDFDADDELLDTVIKTKPSTSIWLQTYLSVCKKLNRLPISSLKNGLVTKRLSLKFVKLEVSDLIPICVAIKKSDEVKEIDFENNNIGPKGGSCIAEAIEENGYVTRLRVVNNGLLTEGLKAIARTAVTAVNLTSLDLSDNGFTEMDVVYLKELVENSDSIQELYISQNSILSDGAKLIAKMLVSPACSLRVLDLSWNHIRLAGAEAIGKALEKNTTLETVNLAWNGLHIEGAIAIGNALKKNSTLKEIDLTCNRFSEVCISHLLNGLSANTSLETIHLGQNHLTCKGAVTVLESIKTNTSSGIKTIDLGTQEVDSDFKKLYDEIREERGLTVIHGIVHLSERKPLSTYDECNEEKLILRCNPLTVLMECMRLQNYRLLDMFNRLDTNNSRHIDINELCEGMLKCGVPLQRDTMLKLLKKLDKDNNRMLDYKEIVDAHGLHQKLVRQYLQDGSKFEETEIGRVSLLLRKIMNKDLIMKKPREVKKDKTAH